MAFDLTDKHSFNALSSWMIDVENNAKKDVLVLFVGCKSDLISKRAVTFEEAMELASKFNAQYIETSSQTGANVEEAFRIMAANLLEKYLEEGRPSKKIKPTN